MEKERREDSQKRKKTLLYLFLVALLMLVATGTVGVLAKYATNFTSAYKQADTAEFWFLTDLAENTAETPYEVYDGTIRFTVMNHDLLNVSEREIQYTVSLESGNTYTLSANTEAKQDFAIDVVDGNYKVEIQSKSPYFKTITLYFRVNTHYADSFYTVTEHSGWCELDLYTGEDSSDVTVTYSGQPDNTIALTANWTADGSGTLRGLASYSHYKLIFFGSTGFSLTQNGKTLQKG